jgi:hypothetical protein
MIQTILRAARPALTAILAAACVMQLTLAAPHEAHGAAQTVSVRDFGARGDGVTNDSAAIQAAMNVSGAKTVVFPAGTYRFERIAVPGDTSIVFQTGATAKIASTGTYGRFFGIYGTSTRLKSNVSLTGGTFYGNANTVAVLRVDYADGITMSNTRSERVDSDIQARWSSHVTVRGCVANNGINGFHFIESRYITVTGCTATNMKKDGILFYDGSRYVTATDNKVDTYNTGNYVGRAGIHTYGSSDATITGNTVLRGRYDSIGIRFRDSNRFWCGYNYIESPGTHGLALDRVGDFPGLNGGDGTFIRNSVINARTIGIDVSEALSNPVRLIDNAVRNTTTIDPSSQPAATGIRLSTPHSIAIGNTVEICDGVGMRIAGSNILVARNTIRNPLRLRTGTRVGVLIDGTGQILVQNTIRDELGNILDGLLLNVYQSAVIRSNSVYGQSRNAVTARGTVLSSVYGDATPPTVAYSQAATNGGVRVGLSARDGGSRVVAIVYRIDWGAPRTMPASSLSTVVTGAGSHSINYSAIDVAGNISTSTTRYFSVPPQ